MPDSSVNIHSDDDDFDFDVESEIELLDPETFLKHVGYGKVARELGFWKFWPVKKRGAVAPEADELGRIFGMGDWTEFAVSFNKGIGRRWRATLWTSCIPLTAPLAHRRMVGNLYPQANTYRDSSPDEIASIRSLVNDIEAIFRTDPEPSEAIWDFRALDRKGLAEAVVRTVLEDDFDLDDDDDDDPLSMVEFGIEHLSIKGLRRAFRGLGYQVSAYKRLRWEKEFCLTGTPVNRAYRVTQDDVLAVARYYEAYFKDIPGFSVQVFGWNRKSDPSAPDYERTGLDKIYVTIRDQKDSARSTTINHFGGLPFRDMQYESLDDTDLDADSLEDLLSTAGYVSKLDSVEFLERSGYRRGPYGSCTYIKPIKQIATGVAGKNESVEMCVAVSMPGPSAFVYIARFGSSGHPLRIGMGNSWIRAFPNSLAEFLPKLEAALASCRHTDNVLAFKARHPELVLHALFPRSEPDQG